MAAALDTPGRAGYARQVETVEIEIDNLRAAFAWSRENTDTSTALQLASSLQPLWLTRGRVQEGATWLYAALGDLRVHQVEVPPAVRARALADKAALDAAQSIHDNIADALQALTLAREI